ncbi:hypothetical protein AKJ51_04650, partial [candidate division MSBL1 archaeon SCGC-AAA382A20]
LQKCLIYRKHHQDQEIQTPEIEGWNICYGNREKITRKEDGQLGDEEELLVGLDEEIRYSRDNKVVLVVFEQSVLKKLRTRFLHQDKVLGVGMKEVSFLCLADLLSNSFEGFESLGLDDVCDRLGISVKQSEVDDMLSPLHTEEENQEIVVQSLRLRRLFLKVGSLVDSNTYN